VHLARHRQVILGTRSLNLQDARPALRLAICP
jgi:hypothetical protein